MDIHERGKALEQAFFVRQNQELLGQLKREVEAGGKLSDLKAATGLADERLLQRLLELGITAESLAAMSLAPLVLVAWADGKMDPKERAAIMAGASDNGIRADSTAGRILQQWLEKQPGDQLKELWLDYTKALCGVLTAGEQVKLADDVMGRSKQVAEAAGGFLGLGSISRVELEMLRDLESAFG